MYLLMVCGIGSKHCNLGWLASNRPQFTSKHLYTQQSKHSLVAVVGIKTLSRGFMVIARFEEL